jgi:hypothetical protein
MQKYSLQGKVSRLDKITFIKAMKGLSIALTDTEIDLLFASSEIPDAKGNLDIGEFVSKVH